MEAELIAALASVLIGAIAILYCFIVSRASKKIGRGETIFREIFSNISGGVAIFVARDGGDDFVLKDINSAAEKIEGVVKGDVIGSSLVDVIGHATELELLDVFRRVWKSGDSERLPSQFWLRGARIKNVHRLPAGEIVAVYDDADERSRMDREIKRRTDELGKLMQEMNCLYGISKLAEEPGITFEEILRGTIEIIPMAWQYPSITYARIWMPEQEFSTSNFKETPWRQRADIVIEGIPLGFVEVGYLEGRPERDEGPFLSGERALLHMIAEQLARSLALKQAQDAVAQQVEALGRLNRDLKETQAELIQMGKLSVMGKMAAEMAHEINNPLGAIRVHIDGLKRDIESGKLDVAEAGRALNTVAKSVDHIAQAVGRMRFFSKQSDDRYESVELNQIVAGALDVLRPQLGKDGIELAERYATSQLGFFGNVHTLEQLFTNLMLNARDAIRAKGGGGSISIETGEDGEGDLYALVVDDGLGMDEVVRAQLFSPFFTTKEDGVGLGMAIVKRIVDAHKGTIEVASAPESGTSFRITFPKDRRTVARR